MGLAGVVFWLTALGIFLQQRDTFDPSAASFGRAVFLLAAAGLIGAIAVLVPLEVSAAIQEEREEGTLDLLLLTGRRPVRVLAEVVVGRALHVVTALLGAVPAFALILTLGGVDPWQVAGLVATALALAVATGGVALVLATAARGVAIPVVGTLAWVVIFLVLIPFRLWWAISQQVPGGGWIDRVSSPVAMVEHGVSAASLLGAGLWAFGGVAAALYGAWRFQHLSSRGWAWDARAWPGPAVGWLGPAAIVTVAWVVLELALARIVRFADAALGGSGAASWVGVDAPGLVLPVVAFAVTWYGAHGLYLRALAWLLPRLDRPRARPLRSGPTLLAIVGPVAWREVFTSSHGALGRVAVALTAGWVLVAALVWIGSGFRSEFPLMWSAIGIWGGTLLGAVLASMGVADERARRTLPLLTVANFAPRRLLGGLVLGAIVRGGPMYALGVGVLLLIRVPTDLRRALAPRYDVEGAVEGAPSFAQALWGHAIAPAAMFSVWACLAWFVVVGWAVALSASARGPSGGRVAGALVGVASPPLLVLAILLVEVLSRGHSDIAFGLLIPTMPDNGFRFDASMVGLGLWSGLAFSALALAHRAVARRMRRGEP
jgi:hypothetical protein